jgi:hypothetical protein
VLQAFGRKHWEVHAALASGRASPLDADLGPGDCIYMPMGTPHAATTETSCRVTTVGVHVVTWSDVLADVWRSLADDPTYEEAIPVGWTADRARFADLLRQRLAALGTALNDIDADAVTEARIQRFLSTRAQLLRGVLVQGQALDAIGDDTVLTVRPGAVCELRRDGDRLTVLLGDRRVDMPGWLEPAMRVVRSSDRFTVRDLTPSIVNAGSRLVLVRRLTREGLLLAEAAPLDG